MSNNQVSKKHKANATGEWGKHAKHGIKRIGNKILRRTNHVGEPLQKEIEEQMAERKGSGMRGGGMGGGQRGGGMPGGGMRGGNRSMPDMDGEEYWISVTLAGIE